MEWYAYDKMTPSPPQRHNLLRHHRVPAARRTSAADVTYLLDPSYSGSGSNTPPSVYRDQLGHLHDPDYRPFPDMPNKRRRTSQVGWTQNRDEAEREREEEEEELALAREERLRRSNRYISYSSLYPSIPSAPPVTTRRRNTVPIPTSGPRMAHHHRAPIPLARARTWESAAPSQIVDQDSDDDDDERDDTSRTRCRLPWSPVSTRQPQQQQQQPATLAADQDYTPSCSEAIRREWHAISFKIRLAVFRMYRRFHRRVD